MAGLAGRFNKGKSKTVADLVKKSRMSVNPHAGFNFSPNIQPDMSSAQNMPFFPQPQHHVLDSLQQGATWPEQAGGALPPQQHHVLDSLQQGATWPEQAGGALPEFGGYQDQQGIQAPFGGYPNQMGPGPLQERNFAHETGVSMPQRNPFGPLTGEQGDISGAAFNNPHLGEEEMTNIPYGGWADQGDPGMPLPDGGWADVQQLNDPGIGMVDPTFGVPQTPPTMTNPMLPDGGWMDEGDPGMMDRDADFMPDPRDTQQVFSHTNRLMEEARTEKEKEATRVAAEAAAAEATARYGGSDAETSKRAEYIEQMNKMFNRQRIMMILAAISGDPKILAMAETSARMETAQMDFNYGEFQNERLAKMRDMLLFDSKGNYSPPKDEAEFYSAMRSMGATSAEMDALSGGLPTDAETKNWLDPTTGERRSAVRSPGPQWQEAGLAEGWEYADDTSGYDTGTKGAQRNEIVVLRNNVAQLTAQLGEDHPQTLAAQEVLKLTEMLYGVTEDAGRSATALNNIWRSIIDSNKDMLGRVDWENVAESLKVDGGGDIENAVDFAEWFENYYVKSENNKLIVDEPGSSAGNPAYPRDQAELDALPDGAWYVDSDEIPKQKG